MKNWKLKSGLLLLCMVAIMGSVWFTPQQNQPADGHRAAITESTATDDGAEMDRSGLIMSGLPDLDEAAEEQVLAKPAPEKPVLSQGFDPDRVRIDALRATSAIELQEMAAQARLAGDEKLAREMELMEDEICGIVARSDFGIDAEVVRDGEGMRRWESFCAGSTPSADSGTASRLMRERLEHVLESRGRLQSRYEELQRTMNPSEALFTMLNEANSLHEIEAIGLLVSSGYIDRDLIPELTLTDGGISETFAVTDRIALEIYGCHRFGHCGPDQAATISLCMMITGCQPGDDYLDLIAWLVSPQQLAMAMMIVDMIQEHEMEPRP